MYFHFPFPAFCIIIVKHFISTYAIYLAIYYYFCFKQLPFNENFKTRQGLL